MLLHKQYYDLCDDIEELRNRVRFLSEALETALHYLNYDNKMHVNWLLDRLELHYQYIRRNYD